MGYSHYDRLSALDATFLEIEDENVHMHVGACALFEAKPLWRDDGGLDIARIRRLVGPALARSRRFRQRLDHVPLLGHPVWVDDERFNLDYHVRHTALPEPGDERQLKRLVGRLMSQKLDYHKPLWEMWFVEGLAGDRFAVVTKLHHCMIDGIAGVDLLALLMDPDAQASVAQAEEDAAAGRPWLPRPPPSPLQLLVGEARRRASLPLEALRAGRDSIAHPDEAAEALRAAMRGLRELLEPGLTPASRTPLNVDVGPHRRFDWLRADLAAVKEVKNRLGGTINDVVLAAVAGGVRTFLEGRGVRVDELDFRAQVPVNVRAPEEHAALGNRVAMLLAPLPVRERERRRRYERVVAATAALKASQQAHGGELLERLGDWTSKELLAALVRLTASQLAYNIVVTNVPGPQVPVHLLGARMLEIYPVVPLFSTQGVGIALFSYDGALCFGFNSDWDAMPDLHELVRAVEAELGALSELGAAA